MSFGSKGGQNQPVANVPQADPGWTPPANIPMPNQPVNVSMPTQPSNVPFMPTKEQVLSQPDPKEPPLSVQQQITKAIPALSQFMQSIPTSLSTAQIIRYLVEGGHLNPAAALTLLAQLPVDLHQKTGALGETFVEPQGLYNLGIRSPGEPAPVNQLDLLKKELDRMRKILKSREAKPEPE